MIKNKYKLFSLIYENATVRVASQQKIIPADQFAVALDAEGVLQAIYRDAARYREEVAIECESIKEQAAKEGFEAGFAAWADKLAELEQHIVEVAKQYEQTLVPVATKSAQKILGAELQLRDDAIVDIVSKTLRAVTQHKQIVIYVNRQHIAALEDSRPQLKLLFEDLQSLSIRERADLEEGSCIIETEGGIINAQLSRQWVILEQAFAAMLEQQAKVADATPKEE